MTACCEQIPTEERERVLALVESGEKTVHYGAHCLQIPYTTIVSRIYRGSTVRQAFMVPIRKRVSSSHKVGNAAWQALGDEVRQ